MFSSASVMMMRHVREGRILHAGGCEGKIKVQGQDVCPAPVGWCRFGGALSLMGARESAKIEAAAGVLAVAACRRPGA
jgi:hypothetical protein